MMEQPTGGILGRLTERVLSLVALGLVVLAGVALWQMGPEGRAAIWSAIWRTALWLALAAALPWTGRLFIGRVLAVGANWAGLVLIAALTAIDLIVGLVLIGGLPAGGWGWLAALAALGLAATYNYFVAEYLAEQAGG